MTIGFNSDRLVMLSVLGQISSPRVPTGAVYRIGYDGQPHIVPATGGIAYNVRVGDPATGWVGDHVEPAVSLRNPDDGANGGLNTFACVGNTATVVSGAAKGAIGTVTGKHGGIEHVMVDFARDVLEQMIPGDQVLVRAYGQGLMIDGFPDVAVTNLDPALAAGWPTCGSATWSPSSMPAPPMAATTARAPFRSVSSPTPTRTRRATVPASPGSSRRWPGNCCRWLTRVPTSPHSSASAATGS